MLPESLQIEIIIAIPAMLPEALSDDLIENLLELAGGIKHIHI